jgi:hypothetical protein
MSSITVESIFNEIIQLPAAERLRLWRMLEKLVKPGSARQTSPESPGRKPRLQPIPAPDSTLELEWLVAHAHEYKGEWVALDGDRLIAHGADHDEVAASAQADGAHLPLIHFVEDPDNLVTIIWS